MKTYDVIVFGAGIDGLTAAAYCAQAGLSVCVIGDLQAGDRRRARLGRSGASAPGDQRGPSRMEPILDDRGGDETRAGEPADWRDAIDHFRPPIPADIWRDLKLYETGLDAAQAAHRITLREGAAAVRTGRAFLESPGATGLAREDEDIGAAFFSGLTQYADVLNGLEQAADSQASAGRARPFASLADPALATALGFAAQAYAPRLQAMFADERLAAHLAAPAFVASGQGPFAAGAGYAFIRTHDPRRWPVKMNLLALQRALRARVLDAGGEIRGEVSVDGLRDLAARHIQVQLSDETSIGGRMVFADVGLRRLRPLLVADPERSDPRMGPGSVRTALMHVALSAPMPNTGDAALDPGAAIYLTEGLEAMQEAHEDWLQRRLPSRLTAELCVSRSGDVVSMKIAACGSGPRLSAGDLFDPPWSEEDREALKARAIALAGLAIPGFKTAIQEAELLMGEGAAEGFGAEASATGLGGSLLLPAGQVSTGPALPARLAFVGGGDGSGALGASAARRALSSVFKRGASL